MDNSKWSKLTGSKRKAESEGDGHVNNTLNSQFLFPDPNRLADTRIRHFLSQALALSSTGSYLPMQVVVSGCRPPVFVSGRSSDPHCPPYSAEPQPEGDVQPIGC